MPRPRKRKTRYSTGGGGARKTRRGRRKSQLPFLEEEELNKEKEKQWWELSEGGEEEEEEEEEEEVNYDHDEEEDEWQAMARPPTKRRLRRLRRNQTLPKLFADWYDEPMLFFVPPMLGRSAIVRLIEKYGGALSDTPPMVKEEDPLVKSVEERARRRRGNGNDNGEEEEEGEEQEEHENVEEEKAPQRVYYLLPPTEGRLPAPTIGNAYSAKFVVDCVKAKRRLAISDYLIPRNKPQSIPDRNIFLPEEEEIMIRYVEKHGENFTPTGNILWRNMSRDGLCPRHTPVSMRNHWRRKLYPRLQLDYPSSPFASPNNISSKRRSSMPYSLPEDEFTGMTLIQLRAALKDRGLHTNGNKPDLLRRLREYKEEQETARKQRRKERRERGEPSESEEEGERNGEQEEGTDEETQVLMSQVEEVLERGNVASEDEEEDGEEDEEDEVQAKKRKQAKKTTAQKQQPPQKKRIAKRKRRGKQQSEAETTKEKEPEKEKEKREVEAMQQEVAESEEVEEVEAEVNIYDVRKRQRQQEMEELATREPEKQREKEDEEEEAEEEEARPIKPKTPTKTSRQMRRLQKEEQLQTERLENIRRKSMQQSVARLNIHKLQNTTGCSEKLVIHALWVFSGDVGKARKYLTLFDTEPDSESRITCIVEELKPWSIEEDKMLMRYRPKDLQALIEYRGSANVFERIRFLMP